MSGVGVLGLVMFLFFIWVLLYLFVILSIVENGFKGVFKWLWSCLWDLSGNWVRWWGKCLWCCGGCGRCVLWLGSY